MLFAEKLGVMLDVPDIGNYVRLRGLKSEKWNGAIGTVVSRNEDGRLGVLLHGYSDSVAKKAIKLENLLKCEPLDTNKRPSCKGRVNLFAFPPCECKPTVQQTH